MPDADARGESGSMSAGPGVRVAFRLTDDVITDARFETAAFDAARPVASALCANLVGSTISDASRWSLLDVARIASLPPTSPIARTVHFAKSAALFPFLGRRARGGAHITCTCFHVEKLDIVNAIRKHRIRTVDELRAHLPATTGCGSCRPDVQRLIDDAARSA
jgi:bacterioferritin-associated ferredoxin